LKDTYSEHDLEAAGLSENEIRVSLVAGSFGNNHSLRAEPQESAGRGADEEQSQFVTGRGQGNCHASRAKFSVE
jgi:hypothetical protein